MKKFAVAVDGPAGSGKSTVAKEIAKALGILYIDTGAMYRTVGMACLKKGINPADEDAVVASLDSLEAGGQRILLDGEDITSRIRTEEIGKAASSVAAYQKVREKLVEIQQGLAKEQSVIMDGRDIGTKVLPDAEVKIYLDASVEERAKRRVGELEAQGKNADLETIREEIAQRDYQDMHRENSPLCRAEDAVNVDTTGLDIPAVTAKLLALIAEKTK